MQDISDMLHSTEWIIFKNSRGGQFLHYQVLQLLVLKRSLPTFENLIRRRLLWKEVSTSFIIDCFDTWWVCWNGYWFVELNRQGQAPHNERFAVLHFKMSGCCGNRRGNWAIYSKFAPSEYLPSVNRVPIFKLRELGQKSLIISIKPVHWAKQLPWSEDLVSVFFILCVGLMPPPPPHTIAVIVVSPKPQEHIHYAWKEETWD